MIDVHVVRRFEEKFKKTDGCWNWESAVAKGYGVLQLSYPERVLVKAPRLSWQIYKGEIPEGLWVLHKCDNPLCVNPEHLFLGTAKDNMEDASRKGRLPGNTTGNGGQPPGEAHSLAKITERDVREIRDLCRHRYMSQNEIAEVYGLSQQEVSKINRGERWSKAIPVSEDYTKERSREAEEDHNKFMQVKDLLSQGVPQKEIAKTVGFSQQKVSMIKSGKIEKYR